MQLPRPTKISTDPGVNSSAMQWAGLLIAALERIVNGTDPGIAFLQLAGLGSHKLDFGSGTLTWGGVTAKSNVLTVSHSLGVAPTVVVATQAGGTAPAFFVIFVWGNGTATGFDIAGAPPAGIPGAGATAPFTWIALA